MTKQPTNSSLPFIFFGTPRFAVMILHELEKKSLLPQLVVTAPDTPQGRGLTRTPPPVKVWAEERGIPVLQPLKLKAENLALQLEERAPQGGWPVIVLAAYGKMLSNDLLEIPERGVINVHPSLLPKYRGPSPIESQILHDDRDTGVSIMMIDEEMDHGPILAQKGVSLDEWPPRARVLEAALAAAGGELLADILPEWAAGEMTAAPQNHDRATYTALIRKEDARINDIYATGDEAYTNFLKICAYEEWPRAYFFDTSPKGGQKRIIITDAKFEYGKLIITRVIPEGRREMNYIDYVRTRGA